MNHLPFPPYDHYKIRHEELGDKGLQNKSNLKDTVAAELARLRRQLHSSAKKPAIAEALPQDENLLTHSDDMESERKFGL